MGGVSVRRHYRFFFADEIGEELVVGFSSDVVWFWVRNCVVVGWCGALDEWWFGDENKCNALVMWW